MKKILGCFLCVMLLVFGVSIPGTQATTIDLEVLGETTIEGAIFGVVSNSKAGRGVYPTFLATQGDAGNPTGVNIGYNSDYRPVEYNEVNTAQHNHSLLLADMGYVENGGVTYYSFALDADQAPGVDSYIYLDQLEVYQTNNPSITGYNSGTDWNLVYQMDPVPNDVDIKINYSWGSGGSGLNDMYVDIPTSFFDSSFTNVVLFANFYGDNDGPQEWSYLAGEGTPPVPEPTTMLLLGAGLVGLAGFGRKKFKK
jgi:hypothetical protein